MKLETLIVQEADDACSSLHGPVYLNASYQANSPEQLAAQFQHLQPGYIYARLQNPSCEALEQRLASMVGALGAVTTNTGMAAVTGALLTLAHAGGHIVAAPTLFSGTLKHLRAIMPKFGVEVEFCDFSDLNAVEEKIQSKTCMVFGEALGNPALKLLDVPALADLCQRKQVPLVLDATLTPPLMLDLGRWPVAVGIHSTTKYIMGNGSLLGGVVFDWGKFPWQQAKDPLLKEAVGEFGLHAFLEHYRLVALHTAGFTQQPFAAAMHEIQLETLAVRHQRQCANAAKLAEFFIWQPALTNCCYLGLESDPSHKLATQLLRNACFGNLITIDLGTQERAFRFLNQLKLVKQMTNLGDLRSLAIHPASTMYHACSDEERQQAGVTPGLVRLSIGVEDVDDLIEDFAEAFAAMQQLTV